MKPNPQLARPIEIKTNRCILGEMRVEEGACWYAFMSDPGINRYLPDRIETEQEMQKVLQYLVGNYQRTIADIERLTLSISKRSGMSPPIGWITYGPLPEDERLKEIGYAIEPKEWGMGYTTEVAKAFISWIQNNITKDTLYATVDKGNLASIRVPEKGGMKTIDAERGIVPSLNHIIYEFR